MAIATIKENDYKLSPSHYVFSNKKNRTLSLEEAIRQFEETKEEQVKADEELMDVFKKLGFSSS